MWYNRGRKKIILRHRKSLNEKNDGRQKNLSDDNYRRRAGRINCRKIFKRCFDFGEEKLKIKFEIKLK